MTGAVSAADAAITASKIVVLMDHIKNNRIEYLLLLALGHLAGATTYIAQRAAGVCA
jgi:acyl CoA:acetate/3-ketoacid CoA transferase beta subunit